MAYHGPNAHLFAFIGKTHWGEPIQDLGPLYQTMSILFVVDLLTVLISSFFLWKVLHLNMLAEFYQVLTKYWYFVAIYLSAVFVGAFWLFISQCKFGLPTWKNSTYLGHEFKCRNRCFKL